MFDPFASLGLERRFDLDAAAIQRAFAVRSADVHARDASEDERDSTLSEINRAKALIEHPESRADTLLLLLGGPTRETERSLPDGFLQEMMEVRQTMEEEIEAASESDARAVSDKWEVWAEARRAGHEARVAAMFREGCSSGDQPSRAALRAIRRELNAWRYIERMIEQLDGGRSGGL
ncbi:MAG: hypothetical protein KF768_01085 [Phycisphaeraceae bacterium]|nr:hypothetical protein [Phycisphaeraceae bacterium]